MYYFDNSATTQIHPEVMEVVAQVSLTYFANPSSAHRLGVQANQLLQAAREQIADILAFKQDEIYFAASGTEVNNWVLQAGLKALREQQASRNKVLISAVEHPSILQQIPRLEELSYDIIKIPVDAKGRLDLHSLEELLSNEVLLVSTMAVNNEVGSIQDLEQIAELLADYPQIVWHVDGVQAVTSQLASLKNPRIDMLTLSSHKFHAVRGGGILAKRQRIALQPLLFGGGQEAGLRSGTENLAAIVATSKALRLAATAQDTNKAKLADFQQRIYRSLEALGWTIFAQDVASEHIICTALAGVPGEVLLHALEAHDVFVSTTSACASRSHKEHASLRAMGVADNLSKSAIRISMSSMTEEAEIDYLITALAAVSQQFESQTRKG